MKQMMKDMATMPMPEKEEMAKDMEPMVPKKPAKKKFKKITSIDDLKAAAKNFPKMKGY